MSQIAPIKPEVVTASSRIAQETLSVQRGDTIYGKLAGFLGVHMDQIDAFSQKLATFAGDAGIAHVQDAVYHDPNHPVSSFIKRNVYLSANEQTMMQRKAEVVGSALQFVTQAGIQFGTRSLATWAMKKENYLAFEQLYSVLVMFVSDAEKGADTARALAELNKIRNSFPLTAAEKKKLAGSVRPGGTLGTLDPTALLANGNSELRDAAAYFLTVLQRQLYHADEPGHTLLPDYYALIDLTNTTARNMIAENTANYDDIAMNQAAYLFVSRKMAKEIALTMPNIDVAQIMQRNEMAAQYDPFAVRRMKVKKTAKTTVQTMGGVGAIIAGIYLQQPALIVNGVSTALTQFTDDQAVIDAVATKCKEWGIEHNDTEHSIQGADLIRLECRENDMK